ncbi:MAG: bifunctional folylpolyglutamate synthase/dihydrofolate synthase, partial [Clostridia bacterium]|nr:bifunctional folylpolyglutamate synthase/dihydrofolate synthase [Clostridia bacterium]
QKKTPGLSRIAELCCKLGNPQKSLRFIHVAGTNGKGSTCAMLSSVLHSAGCKVGMYTSPFIVRFNERMQIDGEQIADTELAEITEYVRPFAESMEDAPTEFELITAIAFVYFARHACDYVVLEAGMGGRLDSTNIIEAENVAVSVITGIAMDHTAFLGDTAEKIAAEKAGIIKKGVPVVFGGAHTPVGAKEDCEVDPKACAAVIKAKAEEMGAPYLESHPELISALSSDIFGSRFDFGGYEGFYIPLAGIYQPYNAATVFAVLDVLASNGVKLTEKAVKEGFAAVKWPGRFEILCKNPLVISDGGHNPEGIDAAVESAKTYFKEKIQLITGVMADKDYAHMAKRMSEVACRAFTVRPDNSRALAANAFADVFEAGGVPAQGFATVKDAVFAAMDEGKKSGKPTLCLGSLYMYGEVKAAVEEYMKKNA